MNDFALFPTIDLTGGCLVHPFEILKIIWESQTDVQSEPLDFWGCNFIHWLSVNFCDSHSKMLHFSFIIGEKISPFGNKTFEGVLWFQTNFLLRTRWKLSQRLLDSVTTARMRNERKTWYHFFKQLELNSLIYNKSIISTISSIWKPRKLVSNPIRIEGRVSGEGFKVTVLRGSSL